MPEIIDTKKELSGELSFWQSLREDFFFLNLKRPNPNTRLRKPKE